MHVYIVDYLDVLEAMLAIVNDESLLHTKEEKQYQICLIWVCVLYYDYKRGCYNININNDGDDGMYVYMCSCLCMYVFIYN